MSPTACLLRGYGRAGTQNDCLSEAVILGTGTPIPAQQACRRRHRDRAGHALAVRHGADGPRQLSPRQLSSVPAGPIAVPANRAVADADADPIFRATELDIGSISALYRRRRQRAFCVPVLKMTRLCRYSKRPPRRGGHFEYRHAHTRAIDMASATPRYSRTGERPVADADADPIFWSHALAPQSSSGRSSQSI